MMPFSSSDEAPAYAAPVWVGRQRVHIAAVAEVIVGGLGFLLLGRVLAGCAAFVLRVVLVVTVVSAAFALGDPREGGCSYESPQFERCERNLRLVYGGALLALAIVVVGSPAWIIWRGEETI